MFKFRLRLCEVMQQKSRKAQENKIGHALWVEYCHTFSDLSVRATLANYVDLCAHAYGRVWIVCYSSL